MLRLGHAQGVGGRHPDLHLPVELEQPARHRAVAAAALRGAACHRLGSASAAVRGVGSGVRLAEDEACHVVWRGVRAGRGGQGPDTGDRVTPRGLPGTLQRDAGGEVAVGSLLPLARQPVVAEVQDAAEVEGLRRRVWGRPAGEEPERSAHPGCRGAAAPSMPACAEPRCHATAPQTSPALQPACWAPARRDVAGNSPETASISHRPQLLLAPQQLRPGQTGVSGRRCENLSRARLCLCEVHACTRG